MPGDALALPNPEFPILASKRGIHILESRLGVECLFLDANVAAICQATSRVQLRLGYNSSSYFMGQEFAGSAAQNRKRKRLKECAAYH